MPQHQPTHPVLLWLQLQLKITTATLNTTIFIKQLALQYFHVSWYVCCIHCWDNLLYVSWQFDCHMRKFSHAFGKYTSTDVNAISSNLSLTLQLLSVLQTLIIKLVSVLQLKLQLPVMQLTIQVLSVLLCLLTFHLLLLLALQQTV